MAERARARRDQGARRSTTSAAARATLGADQERYRERSTAIDVGARRNSARPRRALGNLRPRLAAGWRRARRRRRPARGSLQEPHTTTVRTVRRCELRRRSSTRQTQARDDWDGRPTARSRMASSPRRGRLAALSGAQCYLSSEDRSAAWHAADEAAPTTLERGPRARAAREDPQTLYTALAVRRARSTTARRPRRGRPLAEESRAIWAERRRRLADPRRRPRPGRSDAGRGDELRRGARARSTSRRLAPDRVALRPRRPRLVPRSCAEDRRRTSEAYCRLARRAAGDVARARARRSRSDSLRLGAVRATCRPRARRCWPRRRASRAAAAAELDRVAAARPVGDAAVEHRPGVDARGASTLAATAARAPLSQIGHDRLCRPRRCARSARSSRYGMCRLPGM